MLNLQNISYMGTYLKFGLYGILFHLWFGLDRFYLLFVYICIAIGDILIKRGLRFH